MPNLTGQMLGKVRVDMYVGTIECLDKETEFTAGVDRIADLPNEPVIDQEGKI